MLKDGLFERLRRERRPQLPRCCTYNMNSGGPGKPRAVLLYRQNFDTLPEANVLIVLCSF